MSLPDDVYSHESKKCSLSSSLEYSHIIKGSSSSQMEERAIFKQSTTYIFTICFIKPLLNMIINFNLKEFFFVAIAAIFVTDKYRNLIFFWQNFNYYWIKDVFKYYVLPFTLNIAMNEFIFRCRNSQICIIEKC